MKALNLLIPPIVEQSLSYVALSVRRPLVKSKLTGTRKLHLACGKNVLEGWSNIDINGYPGVINWNLTKPLPLSANSVDFIYCEHFIEHISYAQASALLAECFRVLTPQGVLRFSTPSLKKLIAEYQAGRTDEWRDVGWMPKTPCKLLNEGMRLWGHEHLYDEDELRQLLTELGFQKIVTCGWQESGHAELAKLECRPFHDEIIIEATKNSA